MRELQRQRQRTKGVALDIRAEGGAAEEGGGEEGGDAGDGGAGLDSTFTAQADASEVDPNMLRYIEEQMKNGGSADGAAEGAADGDEDSLYVAPAHMREAIALGHLRHEQAMVQQGADEQGGAATRWLAGIAEASISLGAGAGRVLGNTYATRPLVCSTVGGALGGGADGDGGGDRGGQAARGRTARAARRGGRRWRGAVAGHSEQLQRKLPRAPARDRPGACSSRRRRRRCRRWRRAPLHRRAARGRERWRRTQRIQAAEALTAQGESKPARPPCAHAARSITSTCIKKRVVFSVLEVVRGGCPLQRAAGRGAGASSVSLWATKSC